MKRRPTRGGKKTRNLEESDEDYEASKRDSDDDDEGLSDLESEGSEPAAKKRRKPAA